MLPLMRFDLIDLKLFLAVVDAGSITRGAVDCGLSLSAASERLRDMEADGGVALLERGRRGVLPTRAGEALAHHARLIHRQMGQMRGELAEHAASLRTTIRLHANTAAVAELLPARLAPWMAAHPRVDVELKERQSNEIARAVRAGFAEIGILSDAVDTSGLTLRPFAVDRLVVVAAPDDPCAAEKALSFSRIIDRHFVGLASGALQDHIELRAAKAGYRLQMRLRVANFEGIGRMAAAGVGLGIVPETAARRHRGTPKLAIVRLTDDWAVRRLAVCTLSQEKPAAPALDLVEHLAAFSPSSRGG